MDKIEKLLGMQKVIDSISDKMQSIKEDLNVVTDCVRDKKIISNDVSNRVITGLSRINELSEEFIRLYEEAGISNEISNDLTDLELSIAQAISDIEMDAQLAKYKRFLLLNTVDEDTKILLDAKKSELKSILDNYTSDRENELEPYNKFVEAIQEKDSTKIVTLMLELSQKFGNELIGKAFVLKTITFSDITNEDNSDADDIDSFSDREATIIIEKVSEDEANEEDLIDSENPENVFVEEERNEEAVNPEIENVSELEEIDSISQEVVERGLILTKDIFDKDYYSKISDAETKKVGTKIFTNDLKAKYTAASAMSINYLDKYNSVTPEMIAIMGEAPLVEIELGLDYLQSKGYVRKYGIDGLGSFYCISPRCTKVLQSRDARAFLKIKGVADSSLQIQIEDSVNAVLTRITYSKLSTRYFDQLTENGSSLPGALMDGAFVSCAFSENKEKAYIFMGAFFKNENEASELLNVIKEIYLDKTDYSHILISGINIEYTKELAEFLIGELDFDKEKTFCYSLLDDIYFKFETEEKVDFMKLFDNVDQKDSKAEISGEESNEENTEVRKSDITEKEIIEADNETIDIKDAEKEKPQKEDVEIKENNKETFTKKEKKKESKVIINIDEAMNNAYEMICEGKTYCATTYLRSMMEENDAILHNYERLAYAVNAPWMRCSYSSQQIFSLYSVGIDEFNNYLMAAASLRNFFMNHVSYDYNLKALHANVKEIPIVSESVGLTNVMYRLVLFKESVHNGVDAYAAYRVKDQVAVNKALSALSYEAKILYDNYVAGQPKNHKDVKRFLLTWNSIFSKDNDIAIYLLAIVDKDYDIADLVKDYLIETFISDGCSPDYSNIDNKKLNNFIDEYWDKSHTTGGSHYRSSTLMSGLRNNLINSLEKTIKVMCEWVVLVESTGNRTNDEGTNRYLEERKSLLEELNTALHDLEKKTSSKKLEVAAGAIVLKSTIDELISRMSGSYDENMHKYYYIDFLRGRDVVLNDEFLPDMRGKFVDFEDLSLSNRILRHSKANLMTFAEKLDDIFNNYGDDYGTAELIVKYLEDIGKEIDSEKYNIKKSEEQAREDAKIKLEDFIENLEFAQSCGLIEETKENKKEKIQKIANEWYENAKESRNYGFFNMVLEQYRNKIREDAKVRGYALLQELDKIKAVSGTDERMQKRIERIQENINDPMWYT